MKMPDLQRFGLAGIFGLAVMLFNLSFYLGSIRPVQKELASFEQEKFALLERSEQTASQAEDATRPLPSSYPLPSAIQIPELLRSVYSLAAQRGLIIDRATYVWVKKDDLPRIEINLPIQTSYLTLRAFLAELGELKPAPLIEEMTIKRRLASESSIEANIRISWNLAGTA